MSIPPPDLSARPFQLSVECELSASPALLFAGWTSHLDRWLAAPGTLIMQAEVDHAFYFETHHGAERHPYYGRFLKVVPDRLLEFVWLSTGTQRAETIVTVEFIPLNGGTRLRLTHAGFPDDQSRIEHEEVWPILMHELDKIC